MFVDMIAEGAENPAPPEECAWAVELTEAAYGSASNNQVINLKPS